MGLRPEQQLLESAKTEEDLRLAASLLGLRAEHRGDPQGALRLYLLAQMTQVDEERPLGPSAGPSS